MKHNAESRIAPERMLPLLKSIGREMKERRLAIQAIEARIAGLARSPALHRQEIARLESELSLHRRELRGVEKEMSRLGCSIDEANPGRILFDGTAVSLAFEDTRFFQLSDTRA